MACEPVACGTGDITAVTAGTGLTGGGSLGDVTLNVSFAADGLANAAARADHEHLVPGAGSVAIGPFALAVNSGDGNIALGHSALSSNTSGTRNTATGTGAGSGCIRRFDGSVLAGTCSSDVRFKRDIRPFTPSLDRVAALRPVDYSWRADEYPDRAFGSARTYGLIAQEVEQELPELVRQRRAGFKAVDYTSLPLLASQAIKELKERNDALTASHAAIEQRLEAIEALLASSQKK